MNVKRVPVMLGKVLCVTVIVMIIFSFSRHKNRMHQLQGSPFQRKHNQSRTNEFFTEMSWFPNIILTWEMPRQGSSIYFEFQAHAI